MRSITSSWSRSEEMMSGVIGVETSVTPFGPWSGTKSTIDLIYEPASSYFGNDSFSLQAYDCPWLQDRVSESLTVTIEVTNVPDAPTASDKSRQVDVDTVESIAIWGDSDPFDELHLPPPLPPRPRHPHDVRREGAPRRRRRRHDRAEQHRRRPQAAAAKGCKRRRRQRQRPAEGFAEAILGSVRRRLLRLPSPTARTRRRTPR